MTMPLPCPHCGIVIGQTNVYGLCAGCGKLLPADQRAASSSPQPVDGVFQSNGFKFQIIRDSYVPGLRKELTANELDQPLVRSGKLPDLGGAPVASWILARLAKLTSGKVGFALDDKQRNDGGGFAIEFLVLDKDERRIAEFQLQGDTMGAAILGRRTEECSSGDIIHAVISALLASPADLMSCRLAVTDPEWWEDPEMYAPKPKRGAKNWYGWDGVKFLGENNIKERS